MFRAIRLLVIGVALLPGVTLPCTAAQATDAFSISAGSGHQTTPLMVGLGHGAAMAAWTVVSDGRAGVSANRVISRGGIDPGWPRNGRSLYPISQDRAPASLVPDGSSGAILILTDLSNDGVALWVQRLQADGTIDALWPARGRMLSTGASRQHHAQAVSDGSGGALVVWEDHGSSESDIYAQHVRFDGTLDPSWPARGLAVCGAAGNQLNPIAISSAPGEALIAWVDYRDGKSSDVYATAVRAAGPIVEPRDGRAICSAEGDQTNLRAIADGSGGAILAWEDFRNPKVRSIFAQHVLGTSEADVGWPENGRAVASGPTSREAPRLAADGVGGAIVVWVVKGGDSDSDIAAGHILASGDLDPSWAKLGVIVCSAPGAQRSPVVAGDGAGGAFVAWVDHRQSSIGGYGFDVFAQHLTASGSCDPRWPDAGSPVDDTTPGDQDFPTIIEDGRGGVVVAWSRDLTDIRARWISVEGISAASAGLSVSAAWPNPARSSTTLSLRLPERVHVEASVYDVSGRLVRVLARGSHPAGSHDLAWDLTARGHVPVASGIYFIRVNVGDWRLTRTVAVMR